MKNIELIIFDLDGTLIDSTEDITMAVNFTLKKMGFNERNPDDIKSYIGWGIEDLMKRSLDTTDDKLVKRAIEIVEDYYRSQGLNKISLYSNVKETLEYFKNKKKAIVSNRKYEFTLLALKNSKIYNYFDYILGGDNVECQKPSSCPLDMAINKFKIKKDKTIIVGDMALDIFSGKQAGVITCGVTYGIGKKDDIVKAKPDFIIDDLIELKNIIR